MITTKDKIEQFKRECKSVEYWTKKVNECNEKLEVIAVKLQGISSPAIKEVILENASSPYQENKLYWLLEEERIVNERYEYLKKIEYVNEYLSKINNSKDRQMIIDLHIKKSKHEKVANTYHYANRMALYKHVNKILSNLFKEDTL